MNIAAVTRKIFAVRGIHYFFTRFGGSTLRRLSFDEKYRSGEWKFEGDNPELARLVEQHSNNGHILILGCGSAPIASALNPESFRSVLGIDLSPEAIASAKKRAGEKIRFEVGDMTRFQCCKNYDVILFSDSLNYVNWFARRWLLKKLCRHLTPHGRIIVVTAEPERYAGILRMIRRHFTVELDRKLACSSRHVLTFC
ncbi:MAG TPA: class I SAM-dependent methyltransferase [Verrucomicrobiae bacterium]|nr:class I SAM-dependent methyltransferase [Verrucomicrobiae bacterium]